MSEQQKEIGRLLILLNPIAPQLANRAHNETTDSVLADIKRISGKNPADIISNKAEAFEVFKKLNPGSLEIAEEDRQILKGLCEQGRALGCSATKYKTRINEIRAIIMDESSPGATEGGHQEMLEEMARVRQEYQTAVTSLKQVKGDIETFQLGMEQKKKQAVSQFNVWLADAALKMTRVS